MKTRIIAASLTIVLCLAMIAQPVYGFFGFSVVFDPTHTGKTVAQSLMEQLEFAKSYANQIIQIQHAYNSLLELRKRYELAFQMARKWAELSSYSALYAQFLGAGPAHDPFGTQSGILAAMSGDFNPSRLADSYSASITDISRIDTARLAGTRARADMASIGLADAAAYQALSNSGSVAGDMLTNRSSMEKLSTDALSDAEEANSEISLLNRMNVAAAYQLRSQQDTNTMLVSIANTQAALLKANRDSKARSLVIQDYFNKVARDNWARMCD